MTARPPYERTAQGPGWDELPEVVRRRIEARAGGEVAEAAVAGGGFARGFAGLLDLADDTSIFVKAASHVVRPIAASSYAREAEVLRVLPAAVPAPALLWSERIEDWQVLATIALPRARMPRQPWTTPDLAAAVRACETYAAALRASPPDLELAPMTEGMLEGEWSGRFADITAGRISSGLVTPWVGEPPRTAARPRAGRRRGAGRRRRGPQRPAPGQHAHGPRRRRGR